MSTESLTFAEVTKSTDAHRIFEQKQVSTSTSSNRGGLLSLPSKVLSLLWSFTPFSSKSTATTSSSIAAQEKDVHNFKVYFITSRQQKYEEVKRLLEGIQVEQADVKLPTLERIDALELVAVYRVFKAFKKLHSPCIIEESGLYLNIPGLKKQFPGRFYKEIVEDQFGREAFAEKYNGFEASTRSVFAYTEDGITAHVFVGGQSGQIVNPDNWVNADGWDPFFVPKGFTKPLSELRAFKHIVGMRQLPCAEMRSVMRQKNYSGVYEIHLTLYNAPFEELKDGNNILRPSEEYIAKFKEFCDQMGVKPLVIHMDNPAKPMQLQTAAYHVFKNSIEAENYITELSSKFISAGFPCLRRRIEAMLHNSECPKTDEQAKKADKGNYFEFHARVGEIDPTSDRFALFQQIISSDPYFKISSVGGSNRYFVNAKFFDTGSQNALQIWRRMIDVKLKENGFEVQKEVKPEYCILDDIPNLDEQQLQL